MPAAFVQGGALLEAAVFDQIETVSVLTAVGNTVAILIAECSVEDLPVVDDAVLLQSVDHSMIVTISPRIQVRTAFQGR